MSTEIPVTSQLYSMTLYASPTGKMVQITTPDGKYVQIPLFEMANLSDDIAFWLVDKSQKK